MQYTSTAHVSSSNFDISLALIFHRTECKTTYNNNYSVRNGIRTYYAAIPGAIQVREYQFVEREVLSLFIGLMLISWTSATNAARVYDTCLSKPENHPDHKDWPPTRSFKLP
jgi:hypothetical protein